MGRGLAGAVIKPTAGVVGFASKTVGSIGGAIKESTQGMLGGGGEVTRTRIRPPRSVRTSQFFSHLGAPSIRRFPPL